MQYKIKEIEIAKSEGKCKGRNPIEFNEEQFNAVCGRWRKGKITEIAAMKEVGLKPNTFYRPAKEMSCKMLTNPVNKRKICI